MPCHSPQCVRIVVHDVQVLHFLFPRFPPPTAAQEANTLTADI